MGDNDDDECSSSSFQLASILFGNIDESGRLEDDVLDKESQRHLSSLARLGLSSILNELLKEAELDSQGNNNDESDAARSSSVDDFINNQQLSEDFDVKSPSAIDYSDINELADDIFGNEKIKNEIDNTDYDADDEEPNLQQGDQQLMPPPPLPGKDSNEAKDDDALKKKLETPLASMLPSKYANVDVRELFPDFRHDKVIYRVRFLDSSGPRRVAFHSV